MSTAIGLDILSATGFKPLLGKSIGLVCNHATVASDYRHITEHLLPLHKTGKLTIKAVFGPQHGLWGHTQDNMIEWEGYEDPHTGLTAHSLYGEHREMPDQWLQGIDLMVCDLQDIGSRYYTFTWTLALCLKKCESKGIPVLILDRPNPIGGTQVEGTLLDPAFSSFVGLHPFPTRPGMTMGEIMVHVKQTYFPKVELSVQKMEGWSRSMYFEETGVPWFMPSPNMPTVDTAVVYPGGCLIEGTQLSEGRGTTRPFEMLGAPYIDGWKLCDALNKLNLPGAYFRPIQFEPTFHKFGGEVCEGAFVHVTDRKAFKPFLTYVAIFQEIVRAWPGKFELKAPPYEYEYNLLPFDILAGNDWLRPAVFNLEPLRAIEERTQAELAPFRPLRDAASLY